MFTRPARNVFLALVLLSTVTATSALGQETTVEELQQPAVKPSASPQGAAVDEASELQKLRERLGLIEDQLQRFNQTITALPSQGTTVEQTNKLQKLRERVVAIKHRMEGFNKAVTDSLQLTGNYAGFATLLVGILTVVSAVVGYSITS